MLRKMIRGVAAVGMLVSAPAWAVKFVTPIGGVPYKTWTIVNYLDLDPSGGLQDWAGGTYTYNGHSGIDFTLPNFRAMDAGVPVYAAADGTVIEVHDGEYDRCSRIDPCGDHPNYIRVQHADGVVTSYLHLMTGSQTVHVGDVVTAGETMAMVGSSGLSSDAHLHFEVRQNGQLVETYRDPSAWWVDPLPYAGTQLGALDFGVLTHQPTLTDVVDGVPDAGPMGAGDTAWVWVNFFGAKRNDGLSFNYYAPDGDLFSTRTYATGEIHYAWYINGVDLGSAPEAGKWKIEMLVNSTKIATAFFTVGSVAAVPEPGAWLMMIGGVGAIGAAVRRRRRAAITA